MLHNYSNGHLRYLQVTHIPFIRTADGVRLDALWARDLRATVASIGPLTVAAPEMDPAGPVETWSPFADVIVESEGIRFAGFPAIRGRKDIWKWPSVRSVLRREVRNADIVHTSNLFPPYEGLTYAHRLATRDGKQTVFVIAEDFYDMLEWEWVRTAHYQYQRWRRSRTLTRLDGLVRNTASTASLTLLHTPAAVERYRVWAKNGLAIRQPAHEKTDVISAEYLQQRNAGLLKGDTLVLAAACRHATLKGLDFLLRAVRLLLDRGVRVRVKLFGDGPESQNLRSLAVRLAIGHLVSFEGPVPPGNELRSALARTHVFVMPHRTNDFGRAFFDAMAAGTPVVAFRSAASSATVREGIDGLLCSMDDFEALADAIRRFDRDRVFLAAAANNAVQRALENTATSWHEIRARRIRELTGQTEPRAGAHWLSAEANAQ